MPTLMYILTVVLGLANLILFVMVLIKLFQVEGTGKGILGIICSLYTFIWGWMKHKEQQLTKIMMAWTALIIIQILISIILNAVVIGQQMR
jgi:hypothetical protein